MALLAASQLIISADYNIVTVSLPQIGAALGFTDHGLQLVVDAYVVALGGCLLLGGRAADLLGRRRMFCVGLGLYAISSLAGGVTLTPEILVAARAAQGLGGAVLFPATLTLVTTTFPEGKARARALSIWAGAGASGLSLGALIGGLLTSIFSWRAVFFVNVPVALIVLVCAFALIPTDRPCDHGHFDLVGASTGTAGIALVVAALVEGPVRGWGDTAVLTCTTAGVLLVACFVLVEALQREPLMPMRLFAHQPLATATAVMFLFQVGFAALLYFLALYFGRIHHYEPLLAALGFLPLTLVIFAGTQASVLLIGRLGTTTTLIFGQVCLTVGLVGVAVGMSAQGGYASLLPGIVIVGIGNGLTWTGMFALAAEGIEPEQQGVASAMASTIRQIGGAIGLPILVGVAATDGTASSVNGFQNAIFIAAGAPALGLLVTLVGRRRLFTASSRRKDSNLPHSRKRIPGQEVEGQGCTTNRQNLCTSHCRVNDSARFPDGIVDHPR